MKPKQDELSTLKCELEFLNHGGYRTPVGRRQPLFCMETGADWKQATFIEDSPSCPKQKHCACNPEGDCVLMELVPLEQRHETLPCQHIPLNDQGDTVATLQKDGDRKKVEAALKAWLEKNIARLESEVQTTA